MASLVAEGVTSFKLFMAYPGRLMLNDDEIFRVLRRSAEVGGLVCLHAENGPVIDVLVREALAAGHTAPVFHARTRPPLVEAEAVQRGIALAETAGASLYVVHLSSALALDARRGGPRRGLAVLAETCPQYLLLTDEAYDGVPLEAAKFVMSPPLRAPGDQDALWAASSAGTSRSWRRITARSRRPTRRAGSTISRGSRTARRASSTGWPCSSTPASRAAGFRSNGSWT